ncbi:UPF0235 protein [Devosia pacifica]|uniref:UPF0235 protein GCM10007989_19420 n=1 Tax=Devosia pacifica TaxID=1335967 RepID=A0A918S6S2_9HYPH|nr:UPF0235 protein [Devosia pacifica]
MPGFCKIEKGKLLLRARVTPNAARDAVEGSETRDDGQQVLRVRVRAVPDKGRANTAVTRLLARTTGIAPSAIRLTSGATARIKTFCLDISAEQHPAVLARLAEIA